MTSHSRYKLLFWSTLVLLTKALEWVSKRLQQIYVHLTRSMDSMTWMNENLYSLHFILIVLSFILCLCYLQCTYILFWIIHNLLLCTMCICWIVEYISIVDCWISFKEIDLLKSIHPEMTKIGTEGLNATTGMNSCYTLCSINFQNCVTKCFTTSKARTK